MPGLGVLAQHNRRVLQLILHESLKFWHPVPIYIWETAIHTKEMMMDVAFCALAGRNVYAQEFAALPAVTREQWRRELTCIECKNPASYRKASTDGRAACFVGIPHVEGCELATVGDGTRGDGGTEAEDERYNSGDHIVIDLRLDIEGEANAPSGAAGSRHRRGGRTFGASGGFRRAQMHRKTRTLLRTLIHSNDFAQSSQVIELTGEVSLPAHRFFVPIDTDERPIGLRGFWGRLVSARLRNGTIWLNTDRAVIPIDESELDVLLSIARVESLEELANAHVLVIGKKAISDKKKVYFDFKKDLTRIALIAPVKKTNVGS